MSKYKIPCAFCDKASTSTFQVNLETGKYLIPSCDDHTTETDETRVDMEKGVARPDVAVEKFLKLSPSDLVSEEPPEADAPLTSWKFPERVGYWVTPSGEEVKIAAMSKADFADAVWAIIRANFQRKSAKTAWATQIIPEKPRGNYPKKAIEVGNRRALEKLEDFLDVAEQKKWI